MTAAQRTSARTPTAASARRRRDAWAAVGFLAPSGAGFALFILGPIAAAFLLSFYDWNLLRDPEFIGLENYRTLISEDRLPSILLTTLTISAWVVVANLVLGLAIALALESKVPNALRGVLRLSFVFPLVVSASAVALIWRFMLNRDLGLLNWIVGFASVDRINWLGSSDWSWRSVILVAVWRSVGFNVLLFLAGLQSIPEQLYDAALVDGAGPWQRLRYITLPMLAPVTLFLSVINSINAFQLFAEPLILTDGGPGDSSRTLVVYIYETAFSSFDLGYASTVALVLFVILLVLGALQFWLSARYSHYRTVD